MTNLLIYLASLIGLAVGCHQAYPPAGLIVPSAVVLLTVIGVSLLEGRSDPEQ